MALEQREELGFNIPNIHETAGPLAPPQFEHPRRVLAQVDNKIFNLLSDVEQRIEHAESADRIVTIENGQVINQGQQINNFSWFRERLLELQRIVSGGL